jgi:hypothetical protein
LRVESLSPAKLNGDGMNFRAFAWRLFVGLLVLCCSAASGHAESWTTSQVTRFDVKTSHPASFQRLEAAWEKPGFQGSISAGNTGTISDGTMFVTLSGEPGMDRSLFEARWKEDLRAHGSSTTYKVKREGWYVISGVRPDGTEFYDKVWLLPDGGFSLQATYPHARNATYDRVLERMLKRFRPSLSENIESVPEPPAPTPLGEEDAERLVAEKLRFVPAKGRHLVFDHVKERGGRSYLVVHGYDLVIDDPVNGTGHTATWGWYYVDAQTGVDYEWDLASDALRPIKPLRLR